MRKNILSFVFIIVLIFSFLPILKIKAFTPITLISYEISETTISPNGDGAQDNTSIDIKYSEEAIADINILDAEGDNVREIYHSDAVTNPQTKIWDGKDDSGNTVSDGLYTIQISGTATANADNTISDTSKTITVNTTLVPPPPPDPVHLNIETSVDVPASCNATDTDGLVHEYPQGDSYLAICALETAINNGSISSIQLSNQYPSLGLFVTAINNVVADPNSQYWALYQNEIFANSGITSLSIVAGDIIMLQLHDFLDNNLGDQITLNVHSLVNNTSTEDDDKDGSGSGGGTLPATFSAENALAYLKSAQGADGSFGSSDLYTDWTGIALGAGDVTDSSRDKILSYLNAHNTLSSLVTDNERRAIALLSLGQNPYSFGGVNYVGAITSSFDGAQFGNIDLINDDIFALIPLSSSGYNANEEMIIKDIDFIISKQQSNGSWENSIDITAAAIQALKLFDDLDGADEAISNAEDYLKNAQGNDGGWGNISSTSWAMQTESALNASWNKNSKTGLDYLATQQTNANNNGAVLETNETPENIIWATSYAIPAGLGKPWSEIMQSVSKPATENGSNSSGSNSANNTGTPQTPETPAKPVVCPVGDLFSIITGQACTEFLLTTEFITITKTLLPASPTPAVNLSLNNSSNKNKTGEPAQDENALEINPDNLTATAINALPANKTTPKSIPIVLGIVSGAVILYATFKFFVK